MSTVPFLLNRIGAISIRPGDAPGWRQQDLDDVVRDVLETVNERVRFAQAEASLTAEAQVDVDALDRAIALFRQLDPSRFAPPPALGVFDPSQKIRSLQDLIAGLERPEQFEELEVGLRLQIAGDSGFEWLLCALEDVEDVSEPLEKLLSPKVGLLTDEQLITLWGAIVSETDAERHHRIERSPEIVAEDFFAIASPEDARKKIPRYAANVRPRLERRMLKAGATTFPVLPVGIARMLSWTARASTSGPSALERQALRSLSRIAVCCTQLSGMDRKMVAAAARVREDGYALDGRGFGEAKRKWGENRRDATEAQAALLHELESLVRFSEEMHSPALPVETALRSFKLGLEVMAPDVAGELRGKREIALQRVLCRFLVERGFRAFGTKFGWAEADLQVEDVFGAVVIEAKLVRTPPSSSTIFKWLSQLKSYMDQSPMKQRGALVIFNFSPVPIVAPTQFLHARHLVLPINICTVSPSRRTECIDIAAAPAGSDELVQVTRMLSSARAASGRKDSSRRRHGAR